MKLQCLKILIFLIIIISHVGCEDNNIDPYTLSIDKKSESALIGGGTLGVNVRSNTEWSVSDNASWVTLSADSGSGNGLITITYAPNTTFDSRTAEVTFAIKGDTKTLTLTQAADSRTMSIDKTNEVALVDGGSLCVSITSNTKWSVSDNASWVTLSADSGNGNGSITITYAPNTTFDSRTAEVTFAIKGYSKTLTLTQAALKPSISLSNYIKDVGYAAGMFSITVTTNGKWKVSSRSSWITSSVSSGDSGQTVLSISYIENISSNPLNGKVTFICGKIEKSVEINQNYNQNSDFKPGIDL